MITIFQEEADLFLETLESLNNDYYSSAVKEAATKLVEFMANLSDTVGETVEEIAKQIDVTKSLEKYRKVLNMAKSSQCGADLIQDLEYVEDRVAAAVDSCVFVISVEDLSSLLEAITNVGQEIQRVDSKLQSANMLEKNKLLLQLNTVIAATVGTQLPKLLIADVKQAMNTCVKESCAGVLDQLIANTKKLKECLKTI